MDRNGRYRGAGVRDQALPSRTPHSAEAMRGRAAAEESAVEKFYKPFVYLSPTPGFQVSQATMTLLQEVPVMGYRHFTIDIQPSAPSGAIGINFFDIRILSANNAIRTVIYEDYGVSTLARVHHEFSEPAGAIRFEAAYTGAAAGVTDFVQLVISIIGLR